MRPATKALMDQLIAVLDYEGNLIDKIPEFLSLVKNILKADHIAFLPDLVNTMFEPIDHSRTLYVSEGTLDDLPHEWKSAEAIIKEVRTTKVPVSKEITTNGGVSTWDTYIPILCSAIYHVEESLMGIILVRQCITELTDKDELIFNLIQKSFKLSQEKIMAHDQLKEEISLHVEIANLENGDIDTIFESFLRRIQKNFSAKFVSLWPYNELDDTVALRSFYPSEINGKTVSFSSFDSKVLNCKKNISGKIFQERGPRIFTNIINDPEFVNVRFASTFNLSWCIAFPIIAQNKSIAVLYVFPNSPETAIPEVVLLGLNRFVDQLASVIKLSHLFLEESLLLDFGEFLNVMLEFEDEKSSWDHLATLISKRMNCEACSIFLQNSPDSLQLVGSTGIENDPPYSWVIYYAHEKSLTYYAYNQDEPFIYYSEFKDQYKDIHKSKYREKLISKGYTKAIMFVKILDKNKKPIGIIRCNNKKEDPARHSGKFTKDDLFLMKDITQVISNIYAKVLSIKEREVEREINLNSLHHELLAPVEGMMSHIEWMERKCINMTQDQALSKRLGVKIDDMKQTSRLLDMLVATLGQFDDKMNAVPIVISLPYLLNQCKAFCYNQASHKRLDIKIGFVEPRIDVDALLMMRVFYNLMRNAIKYIDKAEINRSLEITSNVSKDTIQLLFSDNGIGILPNEEEMIFDKFMRGGNAKSVFPEGSGLGLSFCRSILKKHEGSIRVINNRKPTVFEILLAKTDRL